MKPIRPSLCLSAVALPALLLLGVAMPVGHAVATVNETVSEAGGDAAASARVDAPPAWRPETVQQVRILQGFSIRISPGSPMMPPDVLFDLEQAAPSPRFEERRMGKCMAIGNIAGVQSGRGNRLLLFMRNQRIVSAVLEKACRARDYYSGFYVATNTDGQICVDRDVLQSRSGATCKIKRLTEMVEADDRRFP